MSVRATTGTTIPSRGGECRHRIEAVRDVDRRCGRQLVAEELGMVELAAARRGVVLKVLAGGLTPLSVQNLVNFPSASGDRFGAALAIGNVDAATSNVDLVVGIPGQDSGAGAIAIVRGGALTPRTKVRHSDLSPLFDNTPNDGFGSSLAIGNLDGRGSVPSTASTTAKLLDLAIGGPGEAPDLVPVGQGSGAVSLMKGTGAGVVAPWMQITQTFDGHL